jgi:UDP-glucose 4-epimerase
MKKKVLVTGGAGFIGSHLVDILLEKNYEVTVYDDLSFGKETFLPQHPSFRFIQGDILDEQKVVSTIAEINPSVIYHLAALHHIPTCENMPAKALKINIEGTQNILDAAKELQELEKLVFASSGAVYDIVDESLEEETTVTIPYDIYSVSKLSGEQIVKLWAKKYNKKAGIARIFNTIGGRETNAHLVPEIIEQILNGSKTIQLGNTEPKRSYIDTRDTAMGLFSIGDYRSDKSCEIFNVGREDEFNVREIVEMLGEISGTALSIIQDPSRMRKVDRLKQQASIGKITNHTGWTPKYSVRNGLEYAFEFARAVMVR